MYHIFHAVAQKFFHLLRLFRHGVDYEFVVHLHNKTRSVSALFQLCGGVKHCQLDNIARRALQRHIQRDALAESALVGVCRFQLGHFPSAPEKRLHISLFLRRFYRRVHILLYAGIRCEVSLYKLSGTRPRNAQILGKPVFAYAVDDSEVHRFGVAAHFGRNHIFGHAEYLGGGYGVYVRARVERRAHSAVAAEMRHQPEFYLRIVGGDQHVAGRGDEQLSYKRALRLSHGDILQVGFGRRKPARRRCRLPENGVQFIVFVHQRQHSERIGGAQFGYFAVAQDKRNYRVFVFQLRKHLHVGGITAPVLSAAFQSQLSEQYIRELLGGIYVEFPARKRIYIPFEFVQNTFEFPVQADKSLLVHAKARLFHTVKHGHERKLHIRIYLIHTLVLHALTRNFPERERRAGGTGGIYAEGRERVRLGLVSAVGVVQPGEQKHVVLHAAQGDTVP